MSMEERNGGGYGVENLLESSRPFLRGEIESVDAALPYLIQLLRSSRAGECWHKHGSFFNHLLGVYHILKLWKAPETVCLYGIFHSTYSNLYINLAVFDPTAGCEPLRSRLGSHAEHLIHLFCIMPGQSLVHNDLLFLYDESELILHLDQSPISLRKAKMSGLFDGEEALRKKLRSVLPAEGVEVNHIKTEERVTLLRRVVAIFLLMTMEDLSDQLFRFQDDLFDNSNGRFHFHVNDYSASLWPGDGRPGLWLNLY